MSTLRNRISACPRLAEFCAGTTAVALTLATMMVADSVLYAFLGHDRQRATMLDVCHQSAPELLRELRSLRDV